MKRMLKDPLLHFLVMGLMVFFCYHSVFPRGKSVDPYVIDVGREQLLSFLNARGGLFTNESNELLLNGMTPEERRRLVDEFVREIVLYREAKAIGLDEGDYGARRRLIGRFEFVLQSLTAEQDEIEHQEIEDYFQTHKARYLIPARMTFTHVFFNANRGWNNSKRLADQTLTELNANRVPYEEAVAFGDRFLYHTNYVNKEADLVASHFGQAMQTQLFSLPIADNKAVNASWHGPFQSPYGYHLVLVSGKSDAAIPSLSSVQARVHQDAQHQRQVHAMNQLVEAMVSAYSVRLDQTL